MYKGLLLTSLVITVMFGSAAWSQTRSLSGSISLDTGPSEFDRQIRITVSNHSFILSPTLVISRPITSFKSTTISLVEGSTSADYVIDGIIADPVDYSISISCIACSTDLPTQYYSPSGNRFALSGSTYIDPDELPDSLNLLAITRASISGEITLDRISDRTLEFSITVFSINEPSVSYNVLPTVTLAPGMTKTTYSVTGLNRDIGSDRYGVRLQCTNCVGSSRGSQTFAGALSPNENHASIDFLVSDDPIPVVAPTINLLLNSDL